MLAVTPIVGLIVLIGLLQTKFLFSFSALGLRFGRLFDLSGFSPRAFAPRLMRALIALLLAGLGVLMAVIVLRYFFTALSTAGFQVLSESSKSPLLFGDFGEMSFVAFLQSMGYFAVGTLIAGSMLLACGSYFVRLFHFKTVHRMSRAELEAEYREMEPSPELHSARREQLLETDES